MTCSTSFFALLIFALIILISTMVQWMALWHHSKKVLRLNPAADLGLSVRSLHVLTLLPWVLFGYVDFLPQSKDRVNVTSRRKWFDASSDYIHKNKLPKFKPIFFWKISNILICFPQYYMLSLNNFFFFTNIDRRTTCSVRSQLIITL